MAHQHMQRTKPPPVELGHLANQINAMPVAPAAEAQKREIVAKLTDLAAQMKHWAAQVEGFASHLNTLSVHAQAQKYHSGAPSPDGVHYASRGAPSSNGQYANYSSQNTQHYAGSSQYQFQVQQPQQYSQSGRPPSNHDYPSKPLGGAPLDESEKSGKRRRRTDSTRRKKDPLAPKRPPSAYILYQNDVRKQMQDKYPDMSYPEVLGKISESWQTLEESKKKVYLDMVERDKVRYEDEKLRYNSGQEVPAKPTPRRPLATLRAPSDPDPDADAEAEGEPEREPEPEDAEDETEEPEHDEHEQPNFKRTKLGDDHQQPGAVSSQALDNQQATVPRQPSIAEFPAQPTLEYPPASTQLEHAQRVIPYTDPQVHVSPAPQPRVSSASPDLGHTSHDPSPQSTHITPRATHLSPPPSHASPQGSPAASSQMSQSSPQPHRIGVSPQQPHVPIQMNTLPMPHLTQVSQRHSGPSMNTDGATSH